MQNKKIEALVDNVCRSVLLDFECENNDGNMLEVIWNFLIRYIVDDFNDELNNNLNKNAYEFIDIYAAEFRSKKFRERFYKKYHLMNDIELLVNNVRKENKEIRVNLKKDIDKIRNLIKTSGEIYKINTHLGDVHGGRSVALIEFEDGKKIIYKPQKYNQQFILEKLMKSFERSAKESFVFPKIILGNGYSWVEYIDDTKKIYNEENVYYKAGCYLGAFYILSSYDLHFENMIVSGKDIYFIDAETFCNPKKEINDDNLEKLENSVLATGMLPVGKNYIMDLNLSTFFGKAETKSKVIPFQIIDFDSLKGFYYKSSQYESKQVDFYGNEKLLEFFINGFKDFCEFVMKNKDKVSNEIIKLFEKEIFRFRKVRRSTSVYSEFLQAYNDPMYRKNGQYNDIMNILINNSSDAIVAQKEVESLKKQNIPSFYVYSNDRGLYDDLGSLVIKNYINTPEEIKNNIIFKIQALTPKLVGKQVELIKLAYLSQHYKDIENKTLVPTKTQVNNFLSKLIICDSDIEFYSLVITKNYGINYAGITPGLLNAGGWMLTLFYLDPIKYRKIISLIYKKLQWLYNNDSKIEVDNSILTGWGGIELVRRIISRQFPLDQFVSNISVEVEADEHKQLYKILQKEKRDTYIHGSNSAYLEGLLQNILEMKLNNED